MKRRTPVTVEFTSGNAPIRYDWATSATVRRDGSLRVYDGLNQRVYHPAGEWKAYTVEAPQDVATAYVYGKPVTGRSRWAGSGEADQP